MNMSGRQVIYGCGAERKDVEQRTWKFSEYKLPRGQGFFYFVPCCILSAWHKVEAQQISINEWLTTKM